MRAALPRVTIRELGHVAHVARDLVAHGLAPDVAKPR